MDSVWRAMTGFLFPRRCVGCETELRGTERTICGECLARIPLLGMRIAEPKGACEAIIAATSYASPEAQALVKALKYDRVTDAANTLALITVAAARGALERTLLTREEWFLVPIPLHKKRERTRGFNQSALFAEALTHHEPLRHIALSHALERTRNTDTQTEKPDYDTRRANVKDCFSVTAPNAVRGKNVLLVDDVATSGATLAEAARSLKRAGIRHVTALVFAKA